MIVRAIVFVLVTAAAYFLLGLAEPGSVDDVTRTGIALAVGLVAAFFGKRILSLADALDDLAWIRNLFR